MHALAIPSPVETTDRSEGGFRDCRDPFVLFGLVRSASSHTVKDPCYVRSVNGRNRVGACDGDLALHMMSTRKDQRTRPPPERTLAEMEAVALILSMVAIVVSGIAVWYTRTQTQHAGAIRKIEENRESDRQADRRSEALRARQAGLRLHVQRTENSDGSLAEGPFLHAIVVTNEGQVVARDVRVEIRSAENNPMGTQAIFDETGEKAIRVGRVLAGRSEARTLRDDRNVDFTDIGDCEVRWRDDSTDDERRTLLAARPNWQ